MRYAYKAPPILAAPNPPSLSSVNGLGTGGRARLDMGIGESRILIRTGKNVPSNGTVTLNYAASPPSLFISGDEHFGVLSSSKIGNKIVITWGPCSLLPSHDYIIGFEVA